MGRSNGREDGAIVSVVYVEKKDAKQVKILLETNQILCNDYRLMSSCSSRCESSCPLVSNQWIALPVENIACSSKALIPPAIIQFIRDRGSHFCRYSASYIGRSSQVGASGRRRLGKGNMETLSVCQAALFDVCKTVTRNESSLASILSLSSSCCPRKVEFLGDDRSMVLPHDAFSTNCAEFKKFLSQTLNMSQRSSSTERSTDREENYTTDTIDTFLAKLWKRLSCLTQSPRIIRRAPVSPDSGVRQSSYRILWPESHSPHSVNEPTSPGWITVTENGIRQSFDLTQVMFSRGNVSEKIRFGETLVQPNENVLDLYGGIGYFTLPALVHGRARHVVVCEWNPKAVAALRYNLRDNGVVHRSTVWEGDCREVIKAEGGRWDGVFDRVSLGLIPSSEGGWETAVRAIRKDTGGWLHVHGNVKEDEADCWSLWLTCRLQELLLDKGFLDWLVVVENLVKVKSFAPTVNHYVADVVLGPPDVVDKRIGADVQSGVMQKDGSLIPVHADMDPPSCALSDNGVLHQAWMR